MLRLRHGHAISRHDDDLFRIFHDVRGVFRRTLLDRARFYSTDDACGTGVTTKTTQNHGNEAAVHALTHDVRQDRAGRPDQRAGDNQSHIAQRETDARCRPARIGVEHGHNHGHIRAADGHDDKHTQGESSERNHPENEVAFCSEEDRDQRDKSGG